MARWKSIADADFKSAAVPATRGQIPAQCSAREDRILVSFWPVLAHRHLLFNIRSRRSSLVPRWSVCLGEPKQCPNLPRRLFSLPCSNDRLCLGLTRGRISPTEWGSAPATDSAKHLQTCPTGIAREISRVHRRYSRRNGSSILEHSPRRLPENRKCARNLARQTLSCAHCRLCSIATRLRSDANEFRARLWAPLLQLPQQPPWQSESCGYRRPEPCCQLLG
jgi:hypothetical protein